MLTGAAERAFGQVAQQRKRAVALMAEISEMFAAESGIFARGVRNILIEGFKERRIFMSDAANSLAENLVIFGEVSENFADGPAIHGRLPAERGIRHVEQNFFDDDGRLLEQ